jgi:acyl dehydratase
MLTMAYAARLFTRAFGAGSVRHLNTRFTGAAKLGDTVVLSATLSGTEGGLGHYDLNARTASGDELMSGTARVAGGPPQ